MLRIYYVPVFLMRISLDYSSDVPIYQQIADHIWYLVVVGDLSPGELIPPLQSLAKDLRLNLNTVVRAYRELESSGIVEKRGTVGTYIADETAVQRIKKRLGPFLKSMDELLARAQETGITTHELIALLRCRESELRKAGG